MAFFLYHNSLSDVNYGPCQIRLVKAIYSVHGWACTIYSYKDTCQFITIELHSAWNGATSHTSFKSIVSSRKHSIFDHDCNNYMKILIKTRIPSRNWCIFYTLQVKAVKKCIPDKLEVLTMSIKAVWL